MKVVWAASAQHSWCRKPTTGLSVQRSVSEAFPTLGCGDCSFSRGLNNTPLTGSRKRFLKAGVRAQVAFLTLLFGGCQQYLGPRLASAHEHLIRERGVTVEHFDMVLEHLGDALEELDAALHELSEPSVRAHPWAWSWAVLAGRCREPCA